ncbi:inositol monophosphatase family protein [Vibrio spartinae]|uniref:Inositol-1-monophosphatase n=1 Tax=Vibrio spartinae TaxID=1918945 RepID=A0A1N6M3J3_9VIBR|nr:inositol monophosphatase [Vibrio spartinae]SIO94002.1 Inositol-1-monophosphatase [Vibrio spartinae]
MNELELQTRETTLKEILQQAGSLALHHFNSRHPGEYTLKGAQDFLTESDTIVEQYIRQELQAAFPDDGILGEETGGDTKNSQLWVIDPIDGTANFARGIAHFCVVIAFVKDGITLLGGIYNPVTDELYFARKGAYASKNNIPLHIAKTPDLQSASFELGWSNRVPQQHYVNAYSSLLSLGANIRRGASGALALAWVAEGRTDGYAELHMNAWDCLAGLLLVEEAGGSIGRFPESHADITCGGSVLAAAPQVAQALSQATQIEIKPSAMNSTGIDYDN